MNAKEVKTVKQEALRYSKDIVITPAGQTSLKLELPYMNVDMKPLYFFVGKNKITKRFTILIPVESTGILAINSTLAILQPVLSTYGLLLTQEAVIMEESHHSLHIRIKTMTQALIGLDGVRRLWKEQFQNRSNHATEGKEVEPTSDAADGRPSR